jgi:hypothetical protein
MEPAMTDEQDFFRVMLDDPDPSTFPVFADFLEEQGHWELAAIMREVNGAAAWQVGDEWFAGFELPPWTTDPRDCPAFLDLVQRLAAFACRQRG